MKKIVGCLIILIITTSCSHKKKIPDVSGVEIDLKTVRFEKDFFAIDTNHIDNSLQALYTKERGFSQDFLFNILGIPAQQDSITKDVKLFLTTYQTIYKSSLQPFSNFKPIEKDIKAGLQFVHYYFPKYPLPKKIITFIGPINSYAGIITPDNSLAVGLQLYMGHNFSVYQSDEVLNMYPTYISRRFEPEYIPVNCMKNIIDDLFNSLAKTKRGENLIEQMIDEGKKLYVLDAFLPNAPDSLKTGYTHRQLENCYQGESTIWTYFVQNDLLYQTDPTLINPYITDGPSTAELGEWSPGNIGQFVGWQIVKKWMEKDNRTTLQRLIETPAKQIFEEARYKPH